ncbi:Importin subunit alpha-2 [Camellia lanceoleosa]|uniref:Importin subunit alpha-2 n=1 Tax=Camellia lanceoleosa TaxID=1840588 RepID=A0ACC0IB12_9ERIC|nr:Importin subunit alpha-2 [Camellia lanceoleosa]
MIDDADGLEKIENLQSHDNNEIYEKAVKILETYWLEEDDETMPPGDASQPGFNFGGKMKGLCSPLSKCECLTLRTCIAKSVLPGIASLLESSSHLDDISDNLNVLFVPFPEGDTAIRGSVLPGIASLLESCSHLVTLVIMTSPSSNGVVFWDNLTHLFYFDEEDYRTSQKKTFQCMMLHLKIVKFTCSSSNYSGLDFSFVQFLLKNARVLQKMVINMLLADDMVRMDLF